MNKEEKLAENFLKSLGFKDEDIAFEPDGKVPPDFLVEHSIAVEVRRLNQNIFVKGSAEGLEEKRLPLFKLLETYLSEFDSRYEGKSYLVSVNFKRPIEKEKDVKKAIYKTLDNFLKNPTRFSHSIKVTETISLEIHETQPIQGKLFLFAGGRDRNGGGFLLYEFMRNLDYCLTEKKSKVEKHYSKYSTWWLVLVDKVAHGDLSPKEKEEIKLMTKREPVWNKIVILNSINGEKIIEI